MFGMHQVIWWRPVVGNGLFCHHQTKVSSMSGRFLGQKMIPSA